MNTAVLLVEGITEAILVKQILLLIFNPDKISIQVFYRYQSTGSYNVPDYCPNEPQTVFNIWIVGNDEKVVSTLHENADNLLRKGVIKVIGLRDLYSQRYEDRLKRKNKFPLKVYHDVNREFIDNATLQLRKSQKIKLLFSIMEIETWILSFTNIFPKINRDLLPIQIKEKTGYDLINDNLEEYYRPSHILNEILKLIGKTYHKKISEILMLTSHISPEDINNSESFVASFGLFMDEIKQIDRNSLSMR